MRDGAKHLPPVLAEAVADKLAFNKAIAALRRYSLMERDDDHLSVHRLVQMVARDRLPEDEQKKWAEAAVQVVNSARPFIDKFSESGQKAIFRAVEESRRREHNFLSVEHIFYALGEVESPLLTKVLQSNGVDPQMVAPLLEQELNKSYQYAGPKKMYLTDPTRELFTCALKRARKHGRQAIESFDLFVALFANPRGTPADILRRLGADPDRFANLETDDF